MFRAIPLVLEQSHRRTTDVNKIVLVQVSFWVLAVFLGGLHAWHSRHAMSSDGISYLDMGDAYLRGDWSMAVNSYWSPFYSWLTGLAMFVLEPSSYWEFSAVQLVNFIIYLCALACFRLFLRELIAYQRERTARLSATVTLPEWGLLALGYAFFIWSSLELIKIRIVTPDMCVAAFVYLAAGILLRIHRGFDSWLTFALLGLVLGFGYLAKAAMFPLAFVFLGTSLLLLGNLRRGVPRLLIALVVFLSVGGTFIGAVYMVKGRLTFGDTAKLNYAWFVNEPDGTFANQTRRILDQPAVHEFAMPNRATYPRWYDPSYWDRGIVARSTPVSYFTLKRQIKGFFHAARFYYDFFFHMQAGLIVGFLILYLLGHKRSFRIKNFTDYASLFIPAIAGLAMYSLVIVVPRFIASFVVLLWMAIACAVRIDDFQGSRRVVSCATVVMVMVMMIQIAASTERAAKSTVREIVNVADATAHEHWHIANALSHLGVQQGDRVATIGDSLRASRWARLLRVQIVGEIRQDEQFHFWTADPSLKSQVIQAFANTGAKVIVTENIPKYFSKDGWQRIGNTNDYVYVLPQS